MNDQLREYTGLVESLARKLSAGTRAQQVGAEYDDLYQEGLIAIWQTLERGVTPSAEFAENRMRDWIKFLGGQVGMRPCIDDSEEPCPQHVPYEALLPLDDFRVQADG